MKKKNTPNSFTRTSTDEDIKNLFQQSVHHINLTEQSKNKLYSVPTNMETQSPLQRFFEREIIIPLPSLAIFTSVAILLIGVYIGDIMIIKDVPTPKYEIIHLHSPNNTAYTNPIER